MHPLLNTAVKAARRAGKVIMRYSTQIDRLTVENKGRNDFVSQVDREAEAEIIDVLHRAYPDHAIQAEETGRQGSSEFLWIIDPLDGTTNYLHGYPQFAVSIGLYHQGRAHPCLREHIVGTGRARTRLGAREFFRRHQRQACESHVLHGARAATDVTAVGRLHQYDADAVQGHDE